LNHYKKLSDFFVDRKYSVVDKERTWLLTSGEKIVWIIGERIAENFKITANTQRILEIEYSPED
jgi:tRNA(Ile)-lysidine synthase